MYNVRMDGDGNWTNWVHFVTRLNEYLLLHLLPLSSSYSLSSSHRSPTITREEYGSLANVDLMTRAAVVDIYSVFGDGYIHNGNNFGFYEDPRTSTIPSLLPFLLLSMIDSFSLSLSSLFR